MFSHSTYPLTMDVNVHPVTNLTPTSVLYSDLFSDPSPHPLGLKDQGRVTPLISSLMEV